MRASVVIHENGGLEINNVTLNFDTPFCLYLHLSMDVVWILFFGCFSSIFAVENGLDGNSTEPNTEKIELFPPNPTYAGQTRMPRTFFKKIHSGAAFLTGLKLGAILSKKGFELGHGKIASTHSFQIFGKPVNSAMSLSYGNAGSLLPLVDDVPQSDDSLKRTNLKKEDKKVFQVTVVENPINETLEETLQALPSQADEEKISDDQKIDRNNGGGEKNENIVMLYQDSVGEELEEEVKSNFIKEHNKMVKEFNEGMLRRRNSKF